VPVPPEKRFLIKRRSLLVKINFCVLLALFAIVCVGGMGCEPANLLVDENEIDQASEAAVGSSAAETSVETSAPGEAASETRARPPVASGGGGQFLWKPVSETTRKLVVLLPSNLTGQVASCSLSYSGGTERGAWGGIHNGNREHYRFNKAGAGYGGNITVTATLKNGETRSWSIPNGSNRTTH